MTDVSTGGAPPPYPHRPTPARAWGPVVALACGIVAAAIWLWLPTVSYYFVLEDGEWLEAASTATSLPAVFHIPRHDWGGLYVRPLLSFVHRFEWWRFGLEPAPYHRIHLVLAMLCALAVGAWVWDRTRSVSTALMALAIAAWHPLHWPWHAVAVYGVQFLALLGMVLTLWGGHRALDGERRFSGGLAVFGLLLSVFVLEYAVSAPTAVLGLAVLRRDRSALRRVRALAVAFVVFALVRVVLYLMSDRFEVAADARWAETAQAELTAFHWYLPKVAAYALLSVPGIHAWLVAIDVPVVRWTWYYPLLTLGLICLLLLVRRARGRWDSRNAHVTLLDLGALQAAAVLSILAVAPGVLIARTPLPALGIGVAVAWLLMPYVQRRWALGAVLVLLAANGLGTVRLLRKNPVLPLERYQAENADLVRRYRAALAAPTLDAAYVDGQAHYTWLWRLPLLKLATPPHVRWVVDPVNPGPLTAGVIFARVRPGGFQPVALVHSAEELAAYFRPVTLPPSPAETPGP